MPANHCLNHLVLTGLLLGATLLAARPAAQACACCSERASRVDVRVPLDEPTRVQIERMRFGPEAIMTTGMADEPTGLPSGMSSEYDLTVTRDADTWAFALRAPTGMSGTLRFAMPKHIWMFIVDPFGDAKDEGLGPSLYKEWRLSAGVESDGVFRGATPKGQKAMLIFHGRGRGCTEAENFTHWSLLLSGPGGDITFYGPLETP